MIELSSDLGGGKTTFVQGLTAALGYDGPVTSPTFTLSNVYVLAGGREIHHYDLYRLTEGGVLSDELAEDLADSNIVTIIEWADLARRQLPADHLTVTFEVTGDTARKLVFSGGGPQSDSIIRQLSA